MKALDLFAGAGGFSLAAHSINSLSVVAAIEFDRAAAHTYEMNLINRLKHQTKLLQEDILLVNPKELREQLNLNKKELTIILGGPPCQGFSSHRIKDSGVNDPRNKLLLRYFDFVCEFLPKAFLVENVAGLLWERHSDYLKEFKELTSKNGYTLVHCDIVNARDYGVPQNRKRVFILGIRNDIYNKETNFPFPPPATHFNPNASTGEGKSIKTWRTASCVFPKISNEILERYIEEYFLRKTKISPDVARVLLNGLEYESKPIPEDDPCNIHMIPTQRMEERFKATILNGSRTDAGEEFQLKCHSNGYEGHKDVYGRMMIHLPSNTITTGCHNPSKGRFVHPWENHGITLRHAARLQTFPDDFIFIGNSTEQARQIGNAVPPELGTALIKYILQNL
ncbi:DNA cytosine methyltransferase [Enterobacter bugandensis]|uniref:DNA cytosine methyltransferase n=1 Tax=Enterobacter bugandensis TaxID=881260 RepID=UPI001C993472|nr:DNA cytosine methyltransferase [Enterobacter bugandensis]MBY6291425.1 DNA cytosine methyltransferase [Enterobacter bugandensis]